MLADRKVVFRKPSVGRALPSAEWRVASCDAKQPAFCCCLYSLLVTRHSQLVWAAVLAALLTATAAPAQFVADSSTIEHPAARAVMLDNSRDSKRTQEQMLESVAQLMSLDEQAVLSLVSQDNGFAAVRCPECGSRVDQFDLTDLDHVRCSNCKTLFPSPDYPETHAHTGTNLSGEPVEWKYYMKDGKGYQYFFSAVLRHARHHYLAAKTQDLGRLYELTGEETYARSAALIIVALAEAYPHWCARRDHTWARQGTHYGRYIVSERPWKGGVWGSGHFHEMPLPCVFAYDLTYASPVWEELARERGHEVRQPVEHWFRASHRMIVELHEDGGGRFGNLHPYTIRHVVAAGRVLNDPDIIHSVIPWFDGLTQGHFHFDGMWREGTPDYHGQTVWNLGRAFRAVKGYSDPPGHVDTKRGIKLDGGDLADQYPIIQKANRVLAAMKYPDGRRVTLHDTHWTSGGGPISAVPNIELNAYGHFTLSRGDTAEAMQVHLHFCPLTGHGHYHRDRLSMMLWAAGTEILPDLGYATDRRCYRYFATGSLSHNMSYAGWDEPRNAPEATFAPGELNTNLWARSSLLAYDPGEHCEKRVQLVEAESPGPQWQGIEVARRLIMLVAIDEQRSYVFDLFRLRGGDWHESILRASADEDCHEQCTLTLTPRPGTLAGEDIQYGQTGGGVGYRALIHDLRVGDGSEPGSVTWTGKDTGATVRCFLMGQPETQFILARAPIIRPTNNVPSQRDKYQGPYLMRRRTDGPELTSSFAAIYDAWPREGAPRIDAVEWLEPLPAHPHCVAARIRVADREDLIYASLDDSPRTVEGVHVQGQVAVLSRAAGRAAWGYLHGAGHIEADDLSLSGAAEFRPPLTAVVRAADGPCNALQVAGELPMGEALKGVWLRVIHGDGSAHGYRIEGVEAIEGGTRLLIHDDPGFELTDARMHMLFFPNYEIPGDASVEIRVPKFVSRP